MLKITTSGESAETSRLTLIGNLTEADLPALAAAIDAVRDKHPRISLNLQGVTLVDRAAMKQLCLWKQAGLEVTHCPTYVSTWIRQDQGDG